MASIDVRSLKPPNINGAAAIKEQVQHRTHHDGVACCAVAGILRICHAEELNRRRLHFAEPKANQPHRTQPGLAKVPRVTRAATRARKASLLRTKARRASSLLLSELPVDPSPVVHNT